MIDQETIRDLLIAHCIGDDDMWGNITCGCGLIFYGGDEIEAVMAGKRDYNEHLLEMVTNGVNEAIEAALGPPYAWVVTTDEPGICMLTFDPDQGRVTDTLYRATISD